MRSSRCRAQSALTGQWREGFGLGEQGEGVGGEGVGLALAPPSLAHDEQSLRYQLLRLVMLHGNAAMRSCDGLLRVCAANKTHPCLTLSMPKCPLVALFF